MTSRLVALALAGGLLSACGGPSTTPTDAGVDAPIVLEDAGADGGEPDAGPGPRTAARDAAREQLGGVNAAVIAIPEGARNGADFFQLSLVEVRLDAIIGEKSASLINAAGIIGEKSTTLSLPAVAVTTMIISQQLQLAIDDLDALLAGSSWSGSSDPMLAHLGDACVALRDGLLVLRDRMWERFRELTDGFTITPRDVPDYVDQRVFESIGGANAVHVVIEGRSATDTTATIEAFCGDYAATLRVVDAETGEELVPTIDGLSAEPIIASVEVGFDDPRVLRVEVGIPDVSAWTQCTVTARGRRQFRGASEPIDPGEQTAITRESGTWSANASGLESMMSSAVSSGRLAAGRAAAVERFARQASAAVSRLRGLDLATSIDEDDYEIQTTVLGQVVRPLFEAILADSEISSDPMITVHLEAMKAAVEQMLMETAPGHVGTAS